MENRIKEQFSLFADRVSTNDRVSTKTMRADQMRLYLSAMAYFLVRKLRRPGLKATALAKRNCRRPAPNCLRSAPGFA